ncbi:MAG TPA: DNA cytosine methyltransferase [Alphaproteobacteria bacterium]|nr:DNA cytosine methyltransferase [Alphaproteobacteria bacterium]
MTSYVSATPKRNSSTETGSTFCPSDDTTCIFRPGILTAGYPCQPFSIAGSKRAEKDPRHLWPHIKDIVGVIEPEICFFENVSHHLRLGFQQVHDDLRSMGYSVAAGLFTAEEVGAPHKRERLFILAYRDRDRCLGEHGTACGENDPQGRSQCAADTIAGGDSHATGRLPVHETGSGKTEIRSGLQDGESPVADTSGARARVEQAAVQQGAVTDSTAMADPAGEREWREAGNLPEADERPDGRSPQFSDGTSQSMANAMRSGLEGFPRHERPEDAADFVTVSGFPVWPPSPGDREQWGYVADAFKPAVHRMADGMAFRVDRLRLCGNGVVPLVAAYAFRILLAALRA